MKEELEKQLVESFPLLYQDVDKPPTESLMCFGLECGDGWFDLLRGLSEKLEPLIRKYKEQQPDVEHPRAIQVKEKYAGLRFYMTSATDEMWDLIEVAEAESERICEVCGQPGRVRGVGWLTTLCDECDAKS